MNLMYHHQIENIIAQFELGNINKQQAVRSLTDMPEYPDFKGIWEMLIIHIALVEISCNIPNTQQYLRHWQHEISVWQTRLCRFIAKPKPSYRNAVRKHFYQACDDLFKDDYANLLFNMEMHLEDIGNLDDNTIEDELEKLNLASKDMEWFLEQHPARRISDG